MTYDSSTRSGTLFDSSATANDGVKLLLRMVLGILILLHGIGKIQNGPGFVIELVHKFGLPAALAYFVYIGEVLAPVLVIIGLWTRAAALVIAVNMIVAVLLVHTGQMLTLSPQGGWALELQGLYLAVALAVVMLGAGRHSVGGAEGRWN